jgi:phosphoglycolate phosphatase-like HAD superfamily hydrolase
LKKQSINSEAVVIRNILWDLDGTLFDTYPAITYAISKTLNEMGLSVALNVIDGLAHQSLDHCVKTLSQRFKLDPSLLQERFAESYRMVNPVNQPPFLGVREVCELLQTRGGWNGIITHRRVQSTKRLLDAHNMTSYFDDIYSVEQGYPRKPDPAMALAALEKYAMQPDETLLIGDRDLDIQARRAAGVPTCLFGKIERAIPTNIKIENYYRLLEMIIAQS